MLKDYQIIPMREAFSEKLGQKGGAEETRAGQNSVVSLRFLLETEGRSS